MILPSYFHSPVLLPQVTSALKIKENHKYIDATIGGGGYSFEILKGGGLVLGIELDKKAIDYVLKKCQEQKKLCKIGSNLILEQGNFCDIKKIAEKHKFINISGVVFDLGLSSFQLDSSKRGFSYKKDEPLDMRFDTQKPIKAEELINRLDEEELYEIFTAFSEELYSRTIARAIVRARAIEGPIKTTKDLVQTVEKSLRKEHLKNNKDNGKKRLNAVLARIFQAIRIAVNNELANLSKGLDGVLDLLSPGGKILVLSYHSLEDRLVKLKFRKLKRQKKLKIITKKPIVAQKSEIKKNSRSASAKLRIAEKLS